MADKPKEKSEPKETKGEAKPKAAEAKGAPAGKGKPEGGKPKDPSTLRVIWLMSEGAGGGKYKAFAGTLPFGLAFANDRKAVRKLLGKPTKSWNLDEIENDSFDHDDLQVTVVFKNGTIRQLQTALP